MLYIEDLESGRIKFTSRGIKQFKHRFAEIGIDIHSLKDRVEFELSYETYLNTKMFLKGIKNQDPMIDDLLQNIPAFAAGMALRKGISLESAE